LLGKMKPKPKVYVLTAATPKDRIRDLHDALIDALQKDALCTVTFRGRVWRNMLMTSVTRTDEPDSPPSFDVELQNIRTAETANAALPDPADFHAKPQKQRGPQPSAAPAAEEKAALTGTGSQLHAMFSAGADAISGAVL
jgi:hypothetical protein